MRENLKATKSFTYAGRALKAGDSFAAASGDARVLRAVGRAVTYDTAQAVPEVTKEAPILADAPDAPDAPDAAVDAVDQAGASDTPEPAPEAPARKQRAKKEGGK